MLIQRMRDRSEGVFAKILIGLIIIVFALFGFGSITTFLSPAPKVATVNGDDVTQQEMELAVERNRRLLLAQNVNPLDIDEDQLRADVMTSLINRKLLAQKAEDLSLQYSDEQLDQEIVSTPAFQRDGVFDANQFQMVIGGAGFSPMTYREEMRRDKVFGQLMQGISATAFVTDPMIRRAGSISQQQRDIAALRVDLESIVRETVVGEDEIQAYYDSNSNRYRTEETVDLRYVEIRREDLLEEVTVETDDLEAYFDETRDSYVEAESRRVAHILIEIGDQGEDFARAQIDEIYQQILGGADFGELAKERSMDVGSATNGGDLGFAQEGAYVAPFEEAAFALSLNEISQPVQSEFGFHIIKLLELEEGKNPSLDEVYIEVETALRQSLAEDLFVSLSSRLSELAFESSDLQQPAEALDLEIKSTGAVGRSVRDGIAAQRQVLDVAFSDELRLDGNNSDIIELGEYHHVVIRVENHQPSVVRPLGEVTSEVVSALKQEKAVEEASRRAEELVAMLESGSIARFVADQYDLEWEVTAEVDRGSATVDSEIRDFAFSLPRPAEDDKSVGYTLLTGGDAVVVSVTNVINRDSADLAVFEIETMARLMNAQQGNVDAREYQDQLAATAEVERDQ